MADDLAMYVYMHKLILWVALTTKFPNLLLYACTHWTRLISVHVTLCVRLEVMMVVEAVLVEQGPVRR